MGLSQENHLQAVVRDHEISYVLGPLTENNQRPDFLFPREEAYRVAPEEGFA